MMFALTYICMILHSGHMIDQMSAGEQLFLDDESCVKTIEEEVARSRAQKTP